MAEFKIFGATSETQLVALRLALAALQAEKARLVEKYDRRIAALQEAIEAMERGPGPAPEPESPGGEPASPPKRERKSEASK